MLFFYHQVLVSRAVGSVKTDAFFLLFVRDGTQERAAEGASELLKPAPNLDCLETITFGAIGSCELLGSSKLVESAEPQLVEKPGFLRLSHTHVLCIIDYEIYTDTKQLSGRLERRNKGNVGAGAARSITASAVDRSACAEARALTVMQKLMCSGAHGTVTISITEPPCVSCVAALLRFGQQYPGLRINACIDGALFRYGQEVGSLRSLEAAFGSSKSP